MTTTMLSSAEGRAVPGADRPGPARFDATLPEGCATPFDLLRAAKRAGRAFGLGPQDLQLLELYLCFTKRADWAEGRRPLYTRTVLRTAASLGVSPRSVNTAERRLERLGLIRRATRADGMRGGWDREEGGALYGIDLTPLIAAQPALIACADAARARADMVERIRAAISRGLGEARRLVAGSGARLAEAAALLASLPVRTPQGRDAEALQSLLDRVERRVAALRTLCTLVDNAPRPRDPSGAAEENRVPLYTTPMTPENPGRRGTPPVALARDAERGTDDTGEHGLAYLKPRDLSAAMPDAWHDRAGTVPGQFLWHRFTMAAQTRLAPLGVPEATWREAVAVMGQRAAAVSLMLLDANRTRAGNPVRNVAGALRGMTRRAETGALRLHASVYGLVARGRAVDAGRDETRSGRLDPIAFRPNPRYAPHRP